MKQFLSLQSRGKPNFVFLWQQLCVTLLCLSSKLEELSVMCAGSNRKEDINATVLQLQKAIRLWIHTYITEMAQNWQVHENSLQKKEVRKHILCPVKVRSLWAPRASAQNLLVSISGLNAMAI